MEFKYKLNGGKAFLESTEDPDIYVHIVGPSRYRGIEYVLHWGERKIGFSNQDVGGSHTEHFKEENDDGSVTWVFGNIGTYVNSSTFGNPRLADSYTFRDQAEFEQFKQLLNDAFANFDGSLRVKQGGRSKPGNVKFSESLLKRISEGELTD